MKIINYYNNLRMSNGNNMPVYLILVASHGKDFLNFDSTIFIAVCTNQLNLFHCHCNLLGL